MSELIFTNDKTVEILVKQAANAVFDSEENIKTKKLNRIKFPFYLARLRKEINYKMRCFIKLGTNASDWATLELPDFLFFMYYVLRPFFYFYNAYLKKSRIR